MKRESARQSSNSPMAKSSWETSDSSIPSGMMYASKRRPTFSQVLSSKTPIQEKKSIIFHAAVEARPSSYVFRWLVRVAAVLTNVFPQTVPFTCAA